MTMQNFPSVFSAMGILGAGMNIWGAHSDNYRAKQLDELTSKNAETAKNIRREEIRSFTKYAGRVFLILAADITLDATLGYSLHRLAGIKNLNFSVFDYFGIYSFHLIALGYYTSSIDINNPKKSKIAAKAREWLSSKRQKSEKKIKRLDELPQENLGITPQP